MKPFFADTYFYLALVNPRDAGHIAAVTASAKLPTSIVTTQWVLAEVADALCHPIDRQRFLTLLESLETDSEATIIPASDELFQRGVELFRQRSNKHWSLTDCISFLVMRDHGLTEALTADADFTQAGFVALLA